MDIKTVIKSHGFTLERISEAWQPRPITKGALSKSINNNPTVETLRKISDIIGCTVGDFFADETPEPSHTCKCPHCGKPVVIKNTIEKA